MMTRSLVENIDSIPPLPESIQALERVYNDPASTFEDFTKIIEKDPILAADVLKLVNSPLFGLSRKINDITHAVSLLGKDAIRTCAFGSVIENNFIIDLSPYGMSKEDFVKACNLQLSLAIHWVGPIDRNILSILAPSAFMVDLGRVVIAKTLIEEDKVGIIEMALISGEDISQAELTACGAYSSEVTAELFKKWNFDPKTITIIRNVEDPHAIKEEERTITAYLKSIREAILPNGDITDESLLNAKGTIGEFGLDEKAFDQAIKKIQNA
ncbi:MAG: HDOD domain-containing protein [Epsilonproteobacteria bacterium]|nr:HDOD domain-containing protein [Campylobacterota bacterium]